MTEPDPASSNSVRGAVAIALAILSAVFVALAVDAFWFQSTIGDSDQFVERVARLPQDPAVSTAIAATVATELSEQGALESEISTALPEQLEFLAPTLSVLATDLVFDATKALVESEAFVAIWTVIAGTTHETIVAILDGTAQEDDLSFDLDAAARVVIDQLEDAGIDVFSDREIALGEIVLISRESLDVPRRIARSLQAAVWVFPVLAALLLVAAVLVDWDRVRSIQVAGFAAAAAVLANAALLAATRSLYIRGGATAVDEAARRAIWDALTRGYLVLAAIVAIIGLAIGIGAWWYRRLDRPSPALSG